MLHHGQELDVGEAELGGVIGERVRELAVAERAVARLGYAPPRAEVYLVDRPGRAERVGCAAALHPRRIAPLVGEVPNHGCGARRNLAAQAVRVGLVGPAAVARDYVVL